MFGKKTKTVIGVDGMMCAHCEAHMKEAMEKNFSVKNVTASHEKKEVVVISKEPLDEEKVKSVVAETGYTFTGMRTE